MTPPPLNVLTAFAAPIISTELPDCAPLNRDLRTLFLAREAEGDRYRKRDKTPTEQVNIFESRFDLFSWPERPVQALRGFCLETLGRAVTQLNDYDAGQLQELSKLKLLVDCWFHITRYGGSISNHMHPMASWSGIYCVCPGETPADNPGSGVLRFPDARPYAHVYLDPGNVRMKPPFGRGGLNFQLKAGQLLLFPSYLAHEVAAFFGRDERITVAFNCSFVNSVGGTFGF